MDPDCICRPSEGRGIEKRHRPESCDMASDAQTATLVWKHRGATAFCGGAEPELITPALP